MPIVVEQHDLVALMCFDLREGTNLSNRLIRSTKWHHAHVIEDVASGELVVH